jgi:hypothetical protein
MSAPPTAPPAPPAPKPTRFVKWHRRVLAFCLVVFAFELGLFLVVFPWLPAWEMSWIPVHSKRFAALWMSPYFRGLLSGLGLLNIYVAVVEAVKLLRSLFALASE